VLLVGTTAGEVADLRRRLTDRPDLEIAAEQIVDGSSTATAPVGPDIDLVVMSPRAYGPAAGAAATRARARDDVDLDVVETLTPREIDVLALVADGLGNRAVAQALGISEHTVKFHLASIFGKLGASSRTEAVQRGLRLGFIDI
jgi:DNA-binding NarL/FixJ family response regulator